MTRDDIEHAKNGYGFLIPIDTEVNGPTFARIIRRYYDHMRAHLVADNLERSGLVFYRWRDGRISDWQN